MTRAFTDDPVPSERIDELLDAARRAPSAGNTHALEFLVLEGADTGRYWDITLPLERRPSFPWPDLLRAPVLVVPFVDPAAYPARYADADKARTGLGAGTAAWLTPYWWIDGGMAVMTVLLGAEEAGLGALFFGLFEHEPAVRRAFGVPDDLRALGAIAIGRPQPVQRPSTSASRRRPPLADVVHRGSWRGDE